MNQILAHLNVIPKKHLGQNFLVDRQVLEQFLTAADLEPKNSVLEVGAGLGTITRELAFRVNKVVAIEKDEPLVEFLRESLTEFSNVEIIHGDALKLVGEKYFDQVLGAIPFKITSPLLHKILLSEKRPKAVTFIVQKEVAQKITAQAPKATYFSNFVNLFGQAKIIGCPIKPASFWPSPKVESAILRIEIKEKPLIDPQVFSKFLHHGFLHPRKMLKKVFDEDQLRLAGINPTSRPARPTLGDWLKLYSILW